MAERRRLAVLGSPIAHSRSPQLHGAAYRELGLDWEYERAEVRSGDLAGFLGGLDASWRGLSLTMPLKREVLPLLDTVDATSTLTGAANTVLLSEGLHGFNTDVEGISRAFAERGLPSLGTAVVLGGGATAGSVLVALARAGVAAVTVALRTPERALPLAELAERLGMAVAVARLGDPLPAADLLVSTLPGEAPLPDLAGFPRTAALLDVAYEPWPSRLADGWEGPIVNGLDMLLHQALLQVRVFVQGDPAAELPGEEAVLKAMRAAVGGF
ncbi:shikimate dehydrogenase [Naasia sp. SYSU D00057]|uniref:shikimate dehydrogenase n=1 Tax=Naasia sp. SYSU D00057 TaxID=2817380 RepID=UPI001B317414|nr:shikimate dehydrogenase [Naasia sp. SYSU D00057]